jgi:hypothetical protein
MKTRPLFRPVGLREMELIAESNYAAFPPRLLWQPIFYPVMNQQYAEQIAREWNTQDAFSGYTGIVTEFWVEEAFAGNYDVKNVGADLHKELWIPAADLDLFNRNIVGGIKIINAFFGMEYLPSENSELEKILNGFKS